MVMNRVLKKLEFLGKINRYLTDHDMVVDEKSIDKIIDLTFESLNYICNNICGGTLHCSDGCPIYYFMTERKELEDGTKQ